MIFAEVIIDISVKSLDKPFQYLVPRELEAEVAVGTVVQIPFGKGNRMMQGYIIGLSGTPKYAIEKTKSIIGIVKQGVVAESHLLSLAYWIREHYGSTMNAAIKAVMPVRKEVKEQLIQTIVPTVKKEKLIEWMEQFQRKHYTAKYRVLSALLELEDFEAGMERSQLLKQTDTSTKVLAGLEEKGLVCIRSVRSYRNPISEGKAPGRPLTLNPEQREIADALIRRYQQGIREVSLIHGVTGSGKTEIYMSVIEAVISEGKQVIVLIPEIALTFQTVSRFTDRFGDKVSVMHSRLSKGERYDQFERAKTGEIDIMIGPRSALFTPFTKLGLIVIDEEHETSYQSEQPPKYHAREVAVQRARMLDASVILGSATPSIEAYYRARRGEYQLYTLQERAGGAHLPTVHITDMREELKQKNRSIFGRKLAELIRNRLERGEQVILFLNRRGYAGSVSCRSCGEVLKCCHCSVSLTAHRRNRRIEYLSCHYCGYRIEMPERCPVCGSPYLGMFGIGTEKVEELVRNSFAGARVLRMDADTTTGKEGHEAILKQFAAGEADILVGTQMIVKGHDFPNVTLVGILAADLSLNVGDFRGTERTFQLLAQAAGRAGRGEKPGDVVLQTYQPEHYSIVCAAAQDYESFYDQEISARELLHYPPVSNILGVLVLCSKDELAHQLADRIRTYLDRYSGITVLGPTRAALAKAKDIYRYMLYIKEGEAPVLHQIKNDLETAVLELTQYKECSVQFEID